MGGPELARNLRQQEPGRGVRHASAAGTLTISDAGTSCHMVGDLAERLRLMFLRRVYGLTEAQANAFAILV